MAHEPKLSVYLITLTPYKEAINNSTRTLCRHIINQLEDKDDKTPADSYIFLEFFRVFIQRLDTPEMYKDAKNKKSMTTYQQNITDQNVDTNIKLDSDAFTIKGILKGGSYGRQRKKTSIENKNVEDAVGEKDAITDDFYFMVYMPLNSNVITLMVQSYTDETIDSVVKDFWEDLLAVDKAFFKPKIKRFVPKAIINDFKQNAAISNLTFSEVVKGETLLEDSIKNVEKEFKITISLDAVGNDMDMEEFESAKKSLAELIFGSWGKLKSYKNKKAVLKDISTNKTTSFEMESDFDIQPVIYLDKYLNGFSFEKVDDYCSKLLENEIKPQIYPADAIS